MFMYQASWMKKNTNKLITIILYQDYQKRIIALKTITILYTMYILYY